MIKSKKYKLKRKGMDFTCWCTLSYFRSTRAPVYNNNNSVMRVLYFYVLSIYFSYDILYKTFYNVFSVYICDT